jgi:hypothetical protein
MKTKRKFVNVIPKSRYAKDIFTDFMQSLHGMVVVEETDDKYRLVSINNVYGFWIKKEGTPDWQIVK